MTCVRLCVLDRVVYHLVQNIGQPDFVCIDCHVCIRQFDLEFLLNQKELIVLMEALMQAASET